jgi:multisubunit Na+/H+ antiporter MnhB subunit
MVHISVAIARFAESLFWGIAEAAGLALIGGAMAIAALLIGWRSMRRRR